MRTIAVFVALALAVASASSINAVAATTVAPPPTNWTMTLSTLQVVTAIFSYASDCKAAYANLVLSDGCNPQGNCVGSFSYSLNISGCTVHERFAFASPCQRGLMLVAALSAASATT